MDKQFDFRSMGWLVVWFILRFSGNDRGWMCRCGFMDDGREGKFWVNLILFLLILVDKGGYSHICIEVGMFLWMCMDKRG